MLEIIYDARLIQLPEDFTFFGAKPPQWGAAQSFHDFSRVHQLADGGRAVEHGAAIGHYHFGTPNGAPNQSGQGRIEFIVPFDAGSVPYIEKLMRSDGLWVCDKLFETFHTILTPPDKTGYCNSFTIPPNHFYFLGEHNVV